MSKDKILITGAGLCGTLLGIRMAQRGYDVEIREQLPDMRKQSLGGGRSINLALSDRGLRALEKVGLKQEILKECIPMHGRMIHGIDGSVNLLKYSGREGEHINSVSRAGLNMALLDLAESYDNVSINFDSRCSSVNLKEGIAKFKIAHQNELDVEADVIIGTDGAGSAVRQSLMAKTSELLFNYSQDFLDMGYKELTIPAGPNNSFRIEKNVLHIWPRGEYMMIALPNLDGSFTVTLFHPYEGEAGFNTLNDPEKVKAFFEDVYPDAVEHMPTLTDDYFANQVGVLGTIKCYPWQAYGKALIMGDAAHAVVPFYGQGMNASFEDVYVFDEILDRSMGWQETFEAFQQERKANTDAIADLAIDNCYEMRDKVADKDFIKKRKIEMQLEEQHEDYYSKYSLVTFRPDLSYEQAMILGRAQDEFLLDICRKDLDGQMSVEEIHRQIKELEKSI